MLSLGTTAIPRVARNDMLACVHTVTRYYLPDANNPRFDTDGATQVLDQYLRVQCPERLAAKKPESGDVRLTILTDTSGAVTRAELRVVVGRRDARRPVRHRGRAAQGRLASRDDEAARDAEAAHGLQLRAERRGRHARGAAAVMRRATPHA